jgi:hypothetical protein
MVATNGLRCGAARSANKQHNASRAFTKPLSIKALDIKPHKPDRLSVSINSTISHLAYLRYRD